MWWEPETEDEQRLFAQVSRLNELFLIPSRRIAGIYGVGSALDRNERRVPLLLVDPSLRARRPFSFLDSLGRLLELRGLKNPFRRDDPLLVPVTSASEAFQRELQSWDVPADTLLAFAQQPVAARFAPGSEIWSGQERATVGFVLRIDDRYMLSTAGHLVDVLPCEISVHTKKWQGMAADQVEQIGSIEFYNDPMKWPGADVALIEISSNYGVAKSTTSDPVSARTVSHNTPVLLRGALNMNQRGLVVGVLQSTIDIAGRHWENSWFVNEFTDGFGQQGDSGGAVLVESTRAILGHLVGVSGVVRGSGRWQTGIVQDFDTILTFVKRTYNTADVRIENSTLDEIPAPPPQPPTPPPPTPPVDAMTIRIRMPDVRGYLLSEAKRIIASVPEIYINKIRVDRNKANLGPHSIVKIEKRKIESRQPAGTVISQSPEPGSFAARGDIITLTVASSQ